MELHLSEHQTSPLSFPAKTSAHSIFFTYNTLGKRLVKLYTFLGSPTSPSPIIPGLNLTQNVFSEAVKPEKRVKDDSQNF